MGCFDKISFIDDGRSVALNGEIVVGTIDDLTSLSGKYRCAVVAIGNPKARLSLIQKIEKETRCEIVTLISPRAYVSPSAEIKRGSVIEPMAVVHSGCVIGVGCLVSAGAVVNHASVCEDVCHIDCNATVSGNEVVPLGTKVFSGEVFRKAC